MSRGGWIVERDATRREGHKRARSDRGFNLAFSFAVTIFRQYRGIWKCDYENALFKRISPVFCAIIFLSSSRLVVDIPHDRARAS